ncbi:SGNH/GDSL hydrolase family protein [Alicyclobacillus acidiphilus]|uniref:SGNH/GDSL hydrolase family protein n=1 Tax=Alicyclobacillus acidiphilus TaxID=182455 RepID=UPI00082E8AF7|nr:SGNH/GDSL hydrolase family protein [Alicyclobacillus acidiphilus]
MHFVALGDSITYGEGASQPRFAYPSVLARRLGAGLRGERVCGKVLAQPGWTSRDLSFAILENSAMPLRTSRAVIVWIGGDDLAQAALAAAGGPRVAMTLERSLKLYGVFLRRTIAEVRAATYAPMFVCTQYNPFPNSAIAVEGVGLLNQTIASVAASAGAHVVPTADWFAGRQAELIAGYRTGRLRDVVYRPIPVHPNNLGHRVIADGLAGIVAPFVAR